MEKEATKIFGIVLDDASSIYKDIQLQFYKILDLDEKKLSIHENEDVKIKEEIKASIERFSFNLQELDFLAQLKEIIEDEMKKLQTTGNYDLMQDSLLERLKGLRNIDISLEDDFKELSGRIANPFLSRDMFYNYFIARKEKITDMIKSYNQTIIDSLITLTPQLASELSALQSKAKSNTNLNDTQEFQQQTEQILADQEKKMKDAISVQPTQEASRIEQSHQAESINQINSNNRSIQSEKKPEQSIVQNTNSKLLIDNLLAQCGEIYREVSSKFVSSNDSKYKSEIAKGLHQMEKFIENLKDQTFAQEVFERYSKLNNAAQEIIYDDIIFQNVPMLKGVYENSNDLTNTEKRANEPTSPKAPTPVSAYIGVTNEDVENLIKQNKYFSLLQGIPKEEVMKYNGFIYTGYSILVDNWYKRASACKTYDEQHDAYFELYEIYQNFRDYISLEKSNELREQLDNIQKYLNQQAPKNTEMVGVRYNTSKREQASSAMKR